ncbi:hypothetical protein [Deinococcus pimensis]|uniref:hypothetical protein n=1 Tax=Deinococcus pimensis TaxID=309888 RepID=UPI000487C264|nr:hypothetical protein [Deinococcus pimensis]
MPLDDKQPGGHQDELSRAYRDARQAVMDVLMLSTCYPDDDLVLALTATLVKQFMHGASTAQDYEQVAAEARLAAELIMSRSGGAARPLQA